MLQYYYLQTVTLSNMAQIYFICLVTVCLTACVTETSTEMDSVTVRNTTPMGAAKDNIVFKLETLVMNMFHPNDTAQTSQSKMVRLRQILVNSTRKRHLRDAEGHVDFLMRGVALLLQRQKQTQQARRQIAPVEVPPTSLPLTSQASSRVPQSPTTPPPALDTSCACPCVAWRSCQRIKAIDMNLGYARINACSGKLNFSIPSNNDSNECIRKLSETYEELSKVLTDMKTAITKRCFILDTSTILDQTQVLLVLKDTFSQKFEQTNKVVVEDLNTILNTVILRLENVVCPKNTEFVEKAVDNHMEQETGRGSFASCQCVGEWCARAGCSEACGATCRRRALQRWPCPAAAARSDLPLQLLCDGTVHCLDASDEKGCYANIAKPGLSSKVRLMLDSSIKSIMMNENNYPRVRTQLMLLKEDLTTILKEIVTTGNLKKDVVNVTEGILRRLTEIYPKGNEGRRPNSKDVYELLASVKAAAVELVRAFRSDTSIVTECKCVAGGCGSARCSAHCRRLCLARVRLDQYTCRDNTTRVTSMGICDGHVNCPGAEDELICSKDLCQKHHFMKLLQEIERLVHLEKGSLVELLEPWKDVLLKSGVKLISENTRLSREQWRAFVKLGVEELMERFASAPSLPPPGGPFVSTSLNLTDRDHIMLSVFEVASAVLAHSLTYCFV